jgi:hypothetical protein
MGYMKFTHKQKVKMARRMRTRKEIQDRVPIFQTKAWDERSEAIQKRIAKRILENAGRETVV